MEEDDLNCVMFKLRFFDYGEEFVQDFEFVI